jgi:alkylhydroperoxidase family enzyme
MDRERVNAVLDDLENAPIEESVRATLRYLRKLINDPAGINSDDVSRVRSAGVSTEALEDAIQVCAIFSVMARFANAMNFQGTVEEFAREAEGLMITGYAEWRQEPPARDSR